MKLAKTLIIPDQHRPFHDRRAMDLLEQFAQDWRPDEIILLGDVFDLAILSRFLNDPRHETPVQEELDSARQYLAELRRRNRKARITYIEGNHEERLGKTLSKHAPQLVGVRDFAGTEVFTVPALLGLSDLHIHYITGKIDLHGTIVEHGDRASSYSSYTAKRMLDARRVSGVSGHTHRLGAYWYTGHKECQCWLEAGYLGDPAGDAFRYAPTKNWQQGFCLSEYDYESQLHQVSLVEIQRLPGEAGKLGFIYKNMVYRS